MAASDVDRGEETRKSLAGSLARVYESQLFTDVTFLVGMNSSRPTEHTESTDGSESRMSSGRFSFPTLGGELGSITVTDVGSSREEIKAHRLILAARSSTFEAMLYRGDFRETIAGEVIEVPDVEPDIFRAMLRYVSLLNCLVS